MNAARPAGRDDGWASVGALSTQRREVTGRRRTWEGRAVAEEASEMG